MIAGTNAECKILKINVNQTTATLTLLFYATKSTVPAKSFRLAVKDVGTEELTFVDNNYYWIDQINSYAMDSNNVDTKKYKEVMFNIDITKNNTSIIKGTKWVRNCYIYLLDTSKRESDTPAWSSDLLNLISDEFEIPTIKNFTADSRKDNKIDVMFSLSYKSEKDFNYNNSNIDAWLNIRSISSDDIIESKRIQTSAIKLENTIVSDLEYEKGFPVVVQLLITNKNGEVLFEERKIFRPRNKYSNTFIKTETGIKRVIAFYVKLDAKEEHEGEWL